MREMQRRSFLQLGLAAALQTTSLAQTSSLAAAAKAARVASGEDRESKHHTIGVSSTTYKVLTQETGGALFVMEQANHKKGGPSRHLHHNESELFYVIEGEYVVEVGSDRFSLKAGDCVLGPREIPHAWAFVGDTSGRLLISFAPAGKMEEFFSQREKMGIKPGAYASSSADADFMHAYGMELIGPPLKVE